MPLQTLQIYKRKEKIPIEIQIKKMANELEFIKINYHKSEPPKSEPKTLCIEEPRVKSIEWQNTISKMENELLGWIKDYRDLIYELCELDRILPKTEHELQKSDEQAKQNVDKVVKVEDIKEQILTEFKTICIQYEENDEKLRRRIKQLDSQLLGLQAKIENLEYKYKRTVEKCETKGLKESLTKS